MRVIPPLDLSLVSTNVAAASEPSWASGTTYSTGDRVVYDAVTPHVIYEALQGTTGDVPPDSPASWVRVGSTNRWAMFDGISQSVTERSTSIDVTVGLPDFADRLALFNLQADSVQVVVRSGTTTISDTTFSNPGRTLVASTSGLFTNLKLDVTISATTAQCGQFVAGKSQFLGLAQWGYSPDIVDFSKKDVTTFGETTLIQRSFARTLDIPSFMDPSQIDSVNRELVKRRASPAAWDANNPGTDNDELRVYGWLEDSSIDYESPNHAIAQMVIQELT